MSKELKNEMIKLRKKIKTFKQEELAKKWQTAYPNGEIKTPIEINFEFEDENPTITYWFKEGQTLLKLRELEDNRTTNSAILRSYHSFPIILELPKGTYFTHKKGVLIVKGKFIINTLEFREVTT